MRTRAPLLVRLCTGLLVGGLAVGATVAGTRVALDSGRDPSSTPAAARSESADAPGTSAVTRRHDPFDSERGARRVDLATLAAALLLAAVAAWWIAHRQHKTRVALRGRFATRPRAPPRPPALVFT